MHLLTVIILGVATNIDNLCVGLTYGLSGKKLTFLNNLIVSGVSGIFSAAACALANSVGILNAEIAKYTGSALLILVGLYGILEYLFRHDGDKGKEAGKKSRFRELFVLSVILALNGAAASFGAGLAEVPAVPLGISIMLFSFLAVALGSGAGARLYSPKGDKWLNIASGLMLMALGAVEIFL